MKIVYSMRRVAVVALLIVSEHVAASNIWLEQTSREVVTGRSRIEKGMAFRTTSSESKKLLSTYRSGGLPPLHYMPVEVWL